MSDMRSKLAASFVALLAACLVATSYADDDEQEKAVKKKRVRIVVGGDHEDADTAKKEIKVVVQTAGGKHWIGVLANPVSDALKSQLRIEDRLIVEQVVPDSPAAKADVKQHDILLKFGDREIAKLEDLMKAVSENEEKTAKITALRGGKKKVIEITPAKRPATNDFTFVPGEHAEDVRVLLGEWLGDKGKNVWTPSKPMRFHFMGPGFVGGDANARIHAHALAIAGENALPGNLSISVTKSGDKPTKIVVKRDDKTWEITDKDLEKLPKEIRDHVKRMLGQHKLAIGIAPGGKPIQLRSFQLHKALGGDDDADKDEDGDEDGDDDVSEAVKKAVRKKIESLRTIQVKEAEALTEGLLKGGERRIRLHVEKSDGEIEKLRKELKDLRREVEKLKKDRGAKASVEKESQEA